MKLVAETVGNTLVIRIDAERLDAAVAIRFKDRMRELTGQPAPRVVLDLARVTFLDSSGLGALVSVMKSLPPPTRLELACLMPNVQKVMQLTRMESVFRIHRSVSDALSEDMRDAG